MPTIGGWILHQLVMCSCSTKGWAILVIT